MRQKEKECDEIPKGSKLIERSPRKNVVSESEAENKKKELIMMLKELKNELKQEIAELRKEVMKMKEQWKTRVESLEKRMDAIEKKMKETERTIIDRHEEEKEEREARITKLVTERIGRTETVKRNRKKRGREKRQR